MSKIIKNKAIIHTLIVVTLILLAAISLQAGFATNHTIDNSTDGGISTGITSTGNGGTLTLENGVYNKASDRGITINKNMTIRGKTKDKVIIDAQGLSTIFTIGNNTNVTFVNITFTNGHTKGEGGAIANEHANVALNFINCTFTNNTADAFGGAIRNVGNLNVTDCTFTNNTATNSSAISNTNDILLENVIIESGNADNAIYNGVGPLTTSNVPGLVGSSSTVSISDGTVGRQTTISGVAVDVNGNRYLILD